MLAALTVDGKIARTAMELSDWRSREDRRLFWRTSREAGVVVMGRHTYETLPRPLAQRHMVVLTSQAAPAAPPGVEFARGAPAEILASLAQRGYETVVLAGGAFTYRTFIAPNLVDELWLTIEPMAFGTGISLFGDEPISLNLALVECRRLGEHAVLLRYTVRHDSTA
jgi:dihydrofolate reductase